MFDLLLKYLAWDRSEWVLTPRTKKDQNVKDTKNHAQIHVWIGKDLANWFNDYLDKHSYGSNQTAER